MLNTFEVELGEKIGQEITIEETVKNSDFIRESAYSNTIDENNGNKIWVELDKELIPIRKFPKFNKITLTDNFVTHQKWIGSVDQIKEDYLIATILDPKTNDESTAEIPLNEISDDDKELITIGAIFYWNIGLYTHEFGQKTRQSIIKFRRSAPISKEEMKEIKDRAERLSKELNW